MFVIILCVLILVGLQILIAFQDKFFDKLMTSMFLWMIGPFIAFLLCLPLIPVTGGMLRGYSDGTREGFVTKLSEKGIVWKTYESQIQVGTGDMAALQTPFEFSVPKSNKELYDKVKENLGKKVRVEYIEWFVMPYWVGSSGYELTNIQRIK